jgi:hypothetical protein
MALGAWVVLPMDSRKSARLNSPRGFAAAALRRPLAPEDDPMTSTMSLATTAGEQADEEIRQAIAQLVDSQGARFAVQVDRGQVTLFGDPECQEELGELASTFCSITAVTQVQTRFWLKTDVHSQAENQNSSLTANA